MNNKVVHQFSQPLFSLFSHLFSVRHNLVIGLCSAIKTVENFNGYLVNLRTVFLATGLLTLKNAKFHFYCSRELSVFGL